MKALFKLSEDFTPKIIYMTNDTAEQAYRTYRMKWKGTNFCLLYGTYKHKLDMYNFEEWLKLNKIRIM